MVGKAIIIAIVVIGIAALGYYFVLSQLVPQQPFSYETEIQKLNSIVASDVPIETFRNGELFTFNNNGVVMNDFSQAKADSLKSKITSYSRKVPDASSSVDANAMHIAIQIYLSVIDLSLEKKEIFGEASQTMGKNTIETMAPESDP